MLDARSYAADLASLNLTVPPDVAAKYTVTVTSDMTLTPPTYLVTADPTTAQNDRSCGVLTLDNAGVKTKSGTAALADCW